MTPERIELLNLLRTVPTEINESLRSLNGTFLRCGQKAGYADAQEYWSFRHPTLREGFASYIARNSGFLKVFIEGLEDIQVLNQLDCGSGAAKGTLVLVPPSLYGLVAKRVSNMRTSWTWRNWFETRRWKHFLGNRCSKQFLEEYLVVDGELIERCLNFGSYLSATGSFEVLERLNAFGLISEGQRLDALDRVSELAVEIPDADWLDIPELNDLFNDSERSSILGVYGAILCQTSTPQLVTGSLMNKAKVPKNTMVHCATHCSATSRHLALTQYQFLPSRTRSNKLTN